MHRLYKEKCFCVGRHEDRACGCETHVQLSYYLKGLQLWRKAEHRRCSCDCPRCRDSHQLGRAQVADCSSFGDVIHHSEFCQKDPERDCRPLRCAMGFCEHCADYDEAFRHCVKDNCSKRLVRFKTMEPVSSGGQVYDDWVYKELPLQPFLQRLKNFYCDKYRCIHPHPPVTLTLILNVTPHTHTRLHNWVYKWQHRERKRIIDNMRPEQIIILMDYANKYTHWQQDGATCKHDRQSSHLVAFVLSHPTYATSAQIDKTGHQCEAWTFWNEDPKQTPECIHAAVRKIIRTEVARASKRGINIKEVILFTDRCGEQNSGRKNFRMCSETAALLGVVILLIFACPHHFAGVWDAWGGTEAKLLKNVERLGHDTVRTVIDVVLTLRRLRKDMLLSNNCVPVRQVRNKSTGEEFPADESVGDESSGNESSGDESDVEESNVASETLSDATTFKVNACHIYLLQLCPCRSATSCTCVPDPRVPDTIFYRRIPGYDAEVIKGCASMFAYRFLPRQKYVVHIRQYACETCAFCSATRPDVDRYRGCLNLSTVKATSYKCSGYKIALRSDLTLTTGWVQHKITPLRTTLAAGTRATDGLNRVDHQCRLSYVGGLRPGDNVFMTNLSDGLVGDIKPRHYWLGQLLPPPPNHSIVWKTRHALPPDCPAGSYCCKIQWFQRTSRDGRQFTLASAQYISLSCIVPITFKIDLDKKSRSRYEISDELQSKLLRVMEGLVIDD